MPSLNVLFERRESLLNNGKELIFFYGLDLIEVTPPRAL